MIAHNPLDVVITKFFFFTFELLVLKFPGVCLQNFHLGFMDKFAEKTVALTVLYLGVVTE